MSLTQICHQLILNHQKKFLYSVDATCGNGHDTQFLLHNTQSKGFVFAFDIQEQALKTTQESCSPQLTHKHLNCFQVSHELMPRFIPTNFHQKIDLIMFNLGYLPSSKNKILCTQKVSTLKALEHCHQLLKPGGMISILSYPGHPQGKIEMLGIQDWLSKQQSYTYTEHHDVKNDVSPVLWLLRLKQKLE